MHDDDDELSVCMAGKQIVNRNTCYGSNAKNKKNGCLLFSVREWSEIENTFATFYGGIIYA